MTAGPAAVVAVFAAIAVLLATTPADAQADLRPQVRELKSQVRSLRAQLADLERTVHAGTTRRASATEAEADGGQAARNSRRTG